MRAEPDRPRIDGLFWATTEAAEYTDDELRVEWELPLIRISLFEPKPGVGLSQEEREENKL